MNWFCEACHAAQEEVIDNAVESCDDCGEIFPHKELYHWTTYDHCPAQEDEPVKVCSSCRSLPRHLDRVRRNREDYDNEMGFN